MNPTPVLHERARDGAPIVRVLLSNAADTFAVLDVDDYDRLVAAGYRRLYLADNGRGGSYVHTYCRDVQNSRVAVARLLTAAPPGLVVSYRDGDRLNLRRRNLWTKEGSAKGQRLRLPARHTSQFEPDAS